MTASDGSIEMTEIAWLASDVLREKLTEVALADEADSGAVFFLFCREIVLMRNLTYFFFLKRTDRKQNLAQNFFAHRVEKVSLVFSSVGAFHQAMAADVRRSGSWHKDALTIVTRGQKVGAHLFDGFAEEDVKFDFTIAENVWVRRVAGSVLAKKVAEDVVPVFFDELDARIRNVETVADSRHILEILNRGADPVFILLVPVLHEHSNDPVALLFEQCCCHRRIHPA